MVDIHSHILPFVDDGSQSIECSLDLIKKAVAEGIKDIVLTPHYRLRYTCSPKELLLAFDNLKNAVAENNIDINLFLGQEIFYTREVKELLKENKLLTMNGKEYVLIEFPFDTFYDISEAVYVLSNAGYKPIVAHPERYPYFSLNDVLEVKSLGGLIQINSTSLFCVRRKIFRKRIKQLFENNLVDFVASDIHVDRKYCSQKAYRLISKKYGKQVAEDVFVNNAKKLILS